MSEQKPTSGKAADRPSGGKPRVLLCEQWEALLVDALDGTLSATESAAFYAHRETCLACAQLLEESKRGSEWLHFLETEPEVPADLINKILSKTSGVQDTLPAMVPAGVPLPIPAATGWTGGWLPMMERHAAQSRWIMTAAMAFFSIAFTLNMTGVKLNGFRLADLRPTTLASGLTRQFYVANKSVMRYYDNLRFVYELESRVREIRRDAQLETSAPTDKKGVDQPKPGEQKPATKHTGGSAQAPATVPEAEPVRHAEPVMARFEREHYARRYGRRMYARQMICAQFENADEMYGGETNGGRKNVNDKRSEGSLA